MALAPCSDHSNPLPQAFQGLAFMAKKAKIKRPLNLWLKTSKVAAKFAGWKLPSTPQKSPPYVPPPYISESAPRLPDLSSTSTVASCGAPTLPDHQLPSGSSGIQELRGVQGAAVEILRKPSDACSSQTWLCKQRWALPKPDSCWWLRCLEL